MKVERTLVVIDYGMGNLGSIMNMLKRIGANAVLTSDIAVVEGAEKIILPGVGAFAKAMDNLSELDLLPILNTKVIKEKVPFLGICLGMQLLSKTSEEGTSPGLGWIDAETKRFPVLNGFKIPHMGWNTVDIQRESKLFSNMYENPRFYFVHSYYVNCNRKEQELTTTQYAITFCSSLEEANIYGVQYHPEKSHKYGMKLLENFVELC
ncbi:MAG: imidazole glycerol phosphate synthase subunit HisH [Candidatus Heimdallarchaeota archaeon]